MPEPSHRVAYLGLGSMGFAMSTHLVRQGIHITGFDIFEPTLRKFEDACKQIPDASYNTTTSASEAVKKSNVIILMVATHHHVNSALFESRAVMSIPQSATVVIMATVPPTYALEVRQRLDTEFERPDIGLIDAPVSGGTVRSANGTLTVMASSNSPVLLDDPSIRHVLSNVASKGKTLFDIPGGLGAGSSTKALNQVQCGIHIVAGSEIMALAALNRFNTRNFYTIMGTADPTTGKQRYGYTWMFENRGPRMLDPTLPISSAIAIINKDVGIIADEEARLGIELPLLNRAHDVLKQTMAAGMEKVDDAYITRYYLDPSLETTRKDLVVQQTSETSIPKLPYSETTSKDFSSPEAEEEWRAQLLLTAHALINLQSAYETLQFAEALHLLGDEQRKTWFDVIAHAAGGSTVFSEVIPEAFRAIKQNVPYRHAFQAFARLTFSGGQRPFISDMKALIDDAESKGFNPVLLKEAWQFFGQIQR